MIAINKRLVGEKNLQQLELSLVEILCVTFAQNFSLFPTFEPYTIVTVVWIVLEVALKTRVKNNISNQQVEMEQAWSEAIKTVLTFNS